MSTVQFAVALFFMALHSNVLSKNIHESDSEYSRSISEYSLSNKGHLCSDSGRIPVEDLNECINAETWIQSEYAEIPSGVLEVVRADYPRGCSVYFDEGWEGISFNTHSSGSPEADTRQVCKEEVKRPTAYDLAGEWQVEGTNRVWKCSYVSKTEVDCDGKKVTLNGEIVTYGNSGNTGAIVRSVNNYDRINWANGFSSWKKIDLEVCVGDASTWTAGFGKCDTYADNADNNDYCDYDCHGGQCAYQVCEECGKEKGV
jgi:hypothetical protein